MMSCWFCLEFITHIVSEEMNEEQLEKDLKAKLCLNPNLGHLIREHLISLHWALSLTKRNDEANNQRKILIQKINCHEKYLSILRRISYMKKFEIFLGSNIHQNANSLQQLCG